MRVTTFFNEPWEIRKGRRVLSLGYDDVSWDDAVLGSLIHDLVAGLGEHHPLLSHSLSDVSIVTRIVERECDVFVTLAATGNLRVMRRLFEKAKTCFPNGIILDLAKAIEAACAFKQLVVIKWLREPDTVKWIKVEDHDACFRMGVQRALARISDDEDMFDALSSFQVEGVKDLIAERRAWLKLSSVPVEEEGSDSVAPLSPPPPSPPQQKITAAQLTAFKVLTDRSLMNAIGGFHISVAERLARFMKFVTKWTKRCPMLGSKIGYLCRLAIIKGDLGVLCVLYQLSKSDPSPKYSLNQAMHFAACEGQLEILKWLHQRPGNDHKCRPDTMAMVVRCGHANVVEWLHFNCPESKLTMSAFAINEAVRRGNHDVVRVCMKYQLASCDVTTIKIIGEIDSVELLRAVIASSTHLVTDALIMSCIKRGQVAFLLICHQLQLIKLDEKHLAVALHVDTATGHGQNIESPSPVVWFMLRVFGEENEVVKRCALSYFHELSVKGSQYAIQLLLPYVLEAYDASIISPPSTGLNPYTVEIAATIRRLSDSFNIERVTTELGESLPKWRAYIVYNLILSRRLADHDLGQLLCAVSSHSRLGTILRMLKLNRLMHSCKSDLDNSTHLLEWDRNRPTMHPLPLYASRDDAIQALRQAKTVEMARYLVVTMGQFYTRQIVLAAAPSCIMPAVIRLRLMEHPGEEENQVTQFKQFASLSVAPLDWGEIMSLASHPGQELVTVALAHGVFVIDMQLVALVSVHNDVKMFRFLIEAAMISTPGIPRVSGRVLAALLVAMLVSTARGERSLQELPRDAVTRLISRQSFVERDAMFRFITTAINDSTLLLLPPAIELLDPHFLNWISYPPTACRQTMLEQAARSNNGAMIDYILSLPVVGQALFVLPAIVMALRNGHINLVPSLSARKRSDEVINLKPLMSGKILLFQYIWNLHNCMLNLTDIELHR